MGKMRESVGAVVSLLAAIALAPVWLFGFTVHMLIFFIGGPRRWQAKEDALIARIEREQAEEEERARFLKRVSPPAPKKDPSAYALGSRR